MNIIKKYSFFLSLILFVFVYTQTVLAKDQTDNDNSSLHTARDHLSDAFKKYNSGDINSAKQNLKQASDWLDKAISHSKSDKVKSEAKKLSTEIKNFRDTLEHSSEQQQNALSRFWHRVTSLIKRESDHIIHSYTKSQNDNTTLKYILNAKMNFYVADHDLFVSHDPKNAIKELDGSLKNLVEAEAIANPDLKTRIQKIIKNIKTLQQLTGSDKVIWKKDKTVHSLDKAISNLTTAEASATPATILKLKLLEKNILQVKNDIQKSNIKLKYDLIMADFKQIIDNI